MREVEVWFHTTSMLMFGLMRVSDDSTGGGLHVLMRWVGTDTPLAAIILNRRPATVDFSDLPFQWLEDCVVNHPGCRVKKRRLHDALLGETVPLPSRVIDVGPSDGSQYPRLLETHGMRGTYLTLSHCWGTAGVMARTLTENLEARKRRIDIASLSANLRDAIITTRRLGFRYVWIDSLCIIQNSTSDWEVESSKMAQIYNHATLTISASRASSSDAGFLKDSDEASGFVIMIHPRNFGQYYFGKTSPESSSFLSDVERGPLNTRGWTLQERILSRRSIFFGQDQIHWECQTARCSQSTQMEPQEFSGRTGGVSSLKSVLDLKYGSSGSVDQEETLKLWYEMLSLFVKRDLSFPDDKLPALSGIVSIFDKALSGTETSSYQAGLWKQDVERGLMWMVPSQMKKRIPSWSWSSVDSRVWLMRRMRFPVSDISDISFDVKPVGRDRFGRVEHALLEFLGLIREVPRLVQRGDSFSFWDEHKEWLYPNALLKDEYGDTIGKAYLDEPWFEGGRTDAEETTVYCVQIRHNQEVAHHEGKAEALLVCKVSEDMYERVGLVEAELISSGWSRDTARLPSSSSDARGAYQRFLQGASMDRIQLM